MTALLLEMSVFCVRAGYEMRFASYGSKHESQSLYDKPFVCTYMLNLKTTGRIWTFCISKAALLSETFLVWFRVVQ